MVEALLEKAAKCGGLTHREAAVLLECDDPELTERIFRLAKEIKQRFYGNRIVMFAPLYLWHTPQEWSHTPGEREHSRHYRGELPTAQGCRNRNIHTLPGDLPQGTLRGTAPHRTQEQLCIPYRSHGPRYGGRHRRCGDRGALRAEPVPLRLRGTAHARRASGGKVRSGPHTISVPRICPADDISTEDFPDAISDGMFERLVAVIRISVPYTGMIISTRESEAVRRRVLELGVSQISGGSRTSVGGYAEGQPEHTEQFDVSDHRSLDEIVGWLLDLGHIPSFCTACYREGRTGDRFMSLVKSGQIANCCAPNALMTLQEYLEDYASPETKEKGIREIAKATERIPNPKIKAIATKRLEEIRQGLRDFRF